MTTNANECAKYNVLLSKGLAGKIHEKVVK